MSIRFSFDFLALRSRSFHNNFLATGKDHISLVCLAQVCASQAFESKGETGSQRKLKLECAIFTFPFLCFSPAHPPLGARPLPLGRGLSVPYLLANIPQRGLSISSLKHQQPTHIDPSSVWLIDKCCRATEHFSGLSLIALLDSVPRT